MGCLVHGSDFPVIQKALHAPVCWGYEVHSRDSQQRLPLLLYILDHCDERASQQTKLLQITSELQRGVLQRAVLQNALGQPEYDPHEMP